MGAKTRTTLGVEMVKREQVHYLDGSRTSVAVKKITVKDTMGSIHIETTREGRQFQAVADMPLLSSRQTRHRGVSRS